MSVKIYNSLSKKKEELVPIKDKTINIYSCGVTVYDKCHIGHARSLYIFDVIKNYLKYRGYKVNFVRNITDVDDKIIKKANDLKKTFDEVVRENILLYENDLKSLGIPKADFEPRATENIPEMIEYIKALIEKGYAYESHGDVYFSVRKFKDYGKLSGQSIDKMLEAVRIEEDKRKKDPLDFALWKKSKENEPFWESPWGKGRPGWHIECSVMSMKYLKCETLDIHAGGRDLVFPHHENEITQSEALTGKPFAKYWIHHGLLTINGQKMAKSLGNFITVQDALKKYDVNDLKMFFLMSHYASPIDFTQEKFLEVKKVLYKFGSLFNQEVPVTTEAAKAPFVEEKLRQFEEAMDDDFNTPKALGVLFELLSETTKMFNQTGNEKDKFRFLLGAINAIQKIFKEIFGLNLVGRKGELTQEQEFLLQDRINAKNKKDFKRSDELRDQLKIMGIIVEDGKDGQKWRRA